MQYGTIVTVKAIKARINNIKNVGRVRSIEKRCNRLIKLYYHTNENHKQKKKSWQAKKK